MGVPYSTISNCLGSDGVKQKYATNFTVSAAKYTSGTYWLHVCAPCARVDPRSAPVLIYSEVTAFIADLAPWVKYALMTLEMVSGIDKPP